LILQGFSLLQGEKKVFKLFYTLSGRVKGFFQNKSILFPGMDYLAPFFGKPALTIPFRLSARAFKKFLEYQN